MSLQELCRLRIRRRLRKIVWLEHADLEFKKPILAERRRTPSSSARTLRRFVIPIFEESDESLPDEDDDYTGRTRLLLNVDAHSGEAITTTLQLVRAVIQPNRGDENQANDEETQATNTNNRTSHQSSFESVDSTTSSNSTEIQSNHEGKQFPSTEIYQISDSSTSSDSVCDKIDDDDDDTTTSNKTTTDNCNERISRRESNIESYLSMSESDSDQEQDYTIKQRKKIAKREKIDNNGIIDDFRAISDDNTSSSSNNTHPSNSEVVETMDYQTYDIFRDNTTYPLYRPMHNREQRLGNPLDPSMGHYVDSNAFSSYLKEKIHQLPLPHALKLYLNYNRNL